jgi:hypothetical protein
MRGKKNGKTYHISIFGLMCVRKKKEEMNKDLYFIFGL